MTFLFYFQTGQISKSKRRFEKGGKLIYCGDSGKKKVCS